MRGSRYCNTHHPAHRRRFYVQINVKKDGQWKKKAVARWFARRDIAHNWMERNFDKLTVAIRPGERFVSASIQSYARGHGFNK